MKAIPVLALLAIALCGNAQELHPESMEKNEAASSGLGLQTAEDEFAQLYNSLSWQTNGQGELKEWATIEISPGHRFLNGNDANTLMEAFGNLPSEYEGMIAVDDLEWFVLFQFEPSGYVKDDEKDELNADALLKSLKERDKQSNVQRQELGLGSLHTVGWAIEPMYNESTNNLEWGIILEGDEGVQNVNYKTKLLGRHGIMHATLVCEPGGLQAILPVYQEVLKGFDYKKGKSYAEYRQGDKLAGYGLTALITGGALYGAAKLGILAKIGIFFKNSFKAIIAAVLGIGVLLKKLYDRVVAGKHA